MKNALTTAAAASAVFAVAAARECQNVTFDVELSAITANFDISAPANDIEVVDFVLAYTQQGANYTDELLTEYTTTEGTYEIGGTLCTPDGGAGDSPLVIATHGIGFDRSYWDLPFNNFNYSYVNNAVEEYGFSVFFYDRPGIGESTRGDEETSINEIQALLEVDALRAITEGFRDGGLFDDSPVYERIVHAGHSFGAQHTYALTAQYPDISDGIVLQGFSQNTTYLPYFGLGAAFIVANSIEGLDDYSLGYLAPATEGAVQTNFFAPGQFDPELLPVAVEGGQPVTIGELLTLPFETAEINTYAGPVSIVTGTRDLPFCGGDCLSAPNGLPDILHQSIPFFPNTNITIVNIPDAGHALNLEYSHPDTYTAMNDFFVAALESGVSPPSPPSPGGEYTGGNGNGNGSGERPRFCRLKEPGSSSRMAKRNVPRVA